MNTRRTRWNSNSTTAARAHARQIIRGRSIRGALFLSYFQWENSTPRRSTVRQGSDAHQMELLFSRQRPYLDEMGWLDDARSKEFKSTRCPLP